MASSSYINNNKKKRSQEAAFLESMTFASKTHRRSRCACDECGSIQESSSIMSSGSLLAQAVQAYRKKQTQQHSTQTQTRTFQKRSHNIAVYEWTLPLHAEPLVEFGSNHRLVWVQHLKHSLQTIGTGIVGSMQEQQQRRLLAWEQGEVWLVPSTGGKAVGWVHATLPDNNSNKSTAIYASLRVAKVPTDNTSTTCSTESSQQQNWATILREVCHKMLRRGNNGSSIPIQLDQEDARKVRDAIMQPQYSD